MVLFKIKICLLALIISLLFFSILATNSKSIKLSKPMYRNDELERFIAEEKTSTVFDLSSKELTDQDVEIVAYYALYIHKVSIIESSVTIE